MKFNFKKIASVLATTVMLGSTLAFASAAYPAPFVSGGAADAAIVVGAAGANSDMVAATDLKDSLNAGVTATGSATVAGTGDKIQISKSSSKINLGDSVSDIWGTSITKADLPTLLADGTFRNKQNTEYTYNQKFDIGNFTFQDFSDSDYNSRTPALGFKLQNNAFVANYTLQFVTNPESAQSSVDNSLTDLESKNIQILGKTYYILDFKNTSASAGKLTLLDAASTATLNEGESKSVVVGDKTYTVKISFITSDEVVLNVDGTDTEKLSATGSSYGNTYKLPDGTYVGIKNINVQNYAGGTKNVDFSLGKGKLEINGASTGGSVKINDKSIDDLTGYMTFGVTSSKTNWQKLVIKWVATDKKFLTPGAELAMPGFEAIKFTMADTTMPNKETTIVEYGSTDYLDLKTSIKDGDVTIPIMYISTSTGNITGIGQSATQRLATSSGTTLSFNASTSNVNSQFERFIASWNNTRDYESYYLKASVRYDSDAGKNYTTIKNVVTGNDLCVDLSPSGTSTCNIGNIVLTVTGVNYTGGGERTVDLSINSGGSFNRLYTKKGMTIYLPYSDPTAPNSGGHTGGINLTVANESSYVLLLSEANKDGNLGVKNFNLSIGSTGTTTYKTTVSAVGGAGTAYETVTSNKLWESYVVSELATRIVHDKTNTDQYLANVEYHGGEVYANLYVAAPAISATSTGKIQVVTDAEVSSVSDKNLVVVGGSCINTVAATLLGSTTPLCGADFGAKTGAGASGQFVIATYANPLASAGSGKIAMLVAGYDAADTASAVAKVKEGKESTEVNSKAVYPLATA